VAVASSSVVRDHLEEIGFSAVRLWENVADTDLMATAADAVDPVAGHVVFAGNLTTDKVDVELLEAVAVPGQGIELHLAGALAEGGGSRRPWDRLLDLPNVHYHGVLLPEQLGALLGRCTVGLVPYQLNRYTRGVFPMKLYEYLAAGLAVVSTDLPALTPQRHLAIAKDGDAFVRAVRDQVAISTPAVVRARRREGSHPSWRARGEQAVHLIDELMEARGSLRARG
jgi:teichuronic acid biosynthesis glycosyltransferase TuaH